MPWEKKKPVALVPWTAGSYGAPESAYESFRIGPDSRAPGLEGCAGSRRKPERFRGSSLVNTRATANAVGGSNGGGNSRAEGAPLNLVHHAVCACGCGGGTGWPINGRQAMSWDRTRLKVEFFLVVTLGAGTSSVIWRARLEAYHTPALRGFTEDIS